MMETAEALASKIAVHLPDLRTRYPVGKVEIYGSVARGEATEESDIDLLVEFTEVPSLFDMARLQEELESILGRRVDITTPSGLHPRVLANARSDAMPVDV